MLSRFGYKAPPRRRGKGKILDRLRTKPNPSSEVRHSPEQELARFIAKFTPEIAALARAIRARMRRLYPTALELVYDNYNALAIGFGPTERPSEAIFSGMGTPWIFW